MQFRLLAPAFAWLALMFLVFFREYRLESQWNIGGFSQNTMIQFFLFAVLAHLLSGAIMKQMKFAKWKHAVPKIVFLIGLVLATFVEIARYKNGHAVSFSAVNYFFDLAGVLVGISAFRLLYRSCC